MRRQLVVWCLCAGMIGALAMGEAWADDGEGAEQPIKVEESGAKKEKKGKKEKKEKKERREAKREEREAKREAKHKEREEDGAALAARAWTTAQSGEYEEALKMCDRAIKHGARQCYRTKGYAYEKLGDKPSACASYKLALGQPLVDVSAVKVRIEALQCL
jgi:tetratricopeptide (TPR) repeat protein